MAGPGAMEELADAGYSPLSPRREEARSRWPRLALLTAAVAAGLAFTAVFSGIGSSRRQHLPPSVIPDAPRRLRKSGYFLQLSDVHLDPWFNASMGSACFCNAPADAEERARCAASSTGNALGQAGCDAPRTLLHATLAAAVAAQPAGGYDWLVITGDYTRHNVDARGAPNRRVLVRRIMREVLEAVRAFFPDIAVHHGLGFEPLVLGNNDFTADYNLSVTDPRRGANPWFSFLAPSAAASAAALGTYSGKGQRQTLDLLAFADADWSPLDDEATFVFGGYGMRKLTDELYVISLNTVVYSTHLRWRRDRLQEDPFRQLLWLEHALDWLRKTGQARGQKAKALITGHIPPVVDHFKFKPLWRDRFVSAYTGIVGNYSDVVSAQLFAHMHCDTFRLLPGSAGRAPPLFIASSISPVFSNNPSFRVWRYAGSEVLDYTVHSAELRRQGPQEGLSFRPLYTAKEAYGLTAMTAEEWRTKVAERLPHDDALWKQYMSRLWQKSSGADLEADLQSSLFRRRAVCAVNNVRWPDFEACVRARDA